MWNVLELHDEAFELIVVNCRSVKSFLSTSKIAVAPLSSLFKLFRYVFSQDICCPQSFLVVSLHRGFH